MPGLKNIFTDRDGGGFNDLFYSLAIVVLTHVFFWKFMVPGQMVFGTDIQNQSYPIQVMGMREILANGYIPLWNPYMMSGMPFLASFSFHIIYPGSWIFFLTSTEFATGYLFVMHFCMMGVFFYFMAKEMGLSRNASFIGALVFTFNSHLVSLIYPGHGGKIITMAYLPLAIMLVNRAFKARPVFNMAILGLVVGLMFHAGHPQVLFYCGIALLAFFAMQFGLEFKQNGLSRSAKLAGMFAGAFVVGAMLYAVILLPAWEYRSFTHRAGGMTGASSYEFATSFSQPPEDMLYLFLRNPFGWGKDYGPTIPTTDGIFYRGRIGLRLSIDYLSIFGIALALIGAIFRRSRYTWYFTGLAALAGFLALGSFNPLYRLVYSYVPGFSLFRVPYAIMILMPLCAGALAAFGMQYLLDFGDATKKRGLGYLIGAGSVMAVAALGAALYASKNQLEVINRLVGFNWVRQMLWGFYGDINERFSFFLSNVYVFAVMLAVSMLVLFLYRKGILKVKYITAAAAVLILVELWPLGWDFIKTVPTSSIKEVYFKDTPQIRILEEDKSGPFRVFSLVTNNELIYRGIQDLRGYHAVSLGYYESLLGSINFRNSVLDMLGAKYLMLPRNPEYDFSRAPASDREALAKKYEKIYEDAGGMMYRNKAVLPRAWLVNRFFRAASVEQAGGIVADMRFNPREMAILVGDPPSSPSISPVSDLSAQKVTVASYEPDRVELDVYAPADAFLVASEVWYPGWKAYVDGAETKISRTDYALRGMAVPKGEHKVVMEFDPPLFTLGAAVSSLTLLVLLGFIGRETYRKRRGAGGKKAKGAAADAPVGDDPPSPGADAPGKPGRPGKKKKRV